MNISLASFSRPHPLAPHWAMQYLGRPWVADAHGPHAFNCWTFARHVQRVHFGRTLAVVDVLPDDDAAVRAAMLHHPERDNWRVTREPVDGDLVMAPLYTGDTHIGIWTPVDGGKIVQCARGWGVVALTRDRMAMLGCIRPHFYHPVASA